VADPQVIEGRTERIVIVLVGIGQGEPATRPQQPGGLGEGDRGIDPVERGARDDQVERSLGRIELLERGDLETDARVRQPPPGRRDHGRARVDGGQPEAGVGQPLGELTGPAAYFQDRGAGADPRGGADEISDVGRIPGTGLLVAVGNAVEQGPLMVPLGLVPLRFSSARHRAETTPARRRRWPGAHR
jgi:hypothetical protein